MKLLVSVRSVEEALAALDGDADLIDIKEPDRGALGKADDKTIAAIVAAVGGRQPVSAALGELADFQASAITTARLDFAKFGLAGVSNVLWQKRLLECRANIESAVVPCAYADWERADSPPIERVAAFVVEQRFPVLLIDTFIKDGRGLLSWTSIDSLQRLVRHLRNHHCKVALAGSLTTGELESMRLIQPDWVAVRGAVCAAGNRTSQIEERLVRAFKAALITSDTRVRY